MRAFLLSNYFKSSKLIILIFLDLSRRRKYEVIVAIGSNVETPSHFTVRNSPLHILQMVFQNLTIVEEFNCSILSVEVQEMKGLELFCLDIDFEYGFKVLVIYFNKALSWAIGLAHEHIVFPSLKFL